ncbi:glutamate racemase [Psychromonas sp. Urea-02u-13]|uniref:glutamate racemase n=1 Tax=Psychromonas sp. Urea-02u-13 TaxID=2058326 RepID=UPI000C339C8E|nr:glutamate racemase [Psychromonas sp. Urea-02u-13]PKG39441.1 glutamate racemase [Psychromonas sp. Urea-02u-13]
MSAKRVLIFDSGVGGLSVYDEIIKLNPSIKCHYLFDNAYFPYGELPRRKLVSRLTQLLADFMAEYPADLVVIACNSASTIALEDLRQHFSVPIVGVVPAIKPATNNTQNNVIGLLATPATIQRVYTTQLINEFAHGKTVLRIGSTALVKLAEDKLIGKAVLAADFKAVLKPWLSNEADMPDTIVLGCTHFPLIKHEIAACFTRPICLVDSGQAIAERVKQLLENDIHNSNNKADECLSLRPHQAFYTKHFVDKKHLASLQQSFADYGFKQVSFCDI